MLKRHNFRDFVSQNWGGGGVADTTFEVGDHDYTRMSIIPSVCFIIDIPESVESSWYTAKVIVGPKSSQF